MSVRHTLTILETGYTTDKHGTPSYYAVIVSPAPSPLPFTITDHEHLRISADQYGQIRPGHTTVTLNVHDGFFKLPWYEGGYRFSY